MEPLLGRVHRSKLLYNRNLDQVTQMATSALYRTIEYVDGSSEAGNDEWLVLKAKSGDFAAFVELRKRHSSKLFWTAYRITRNWEDAEDTVQESFLKAYLHLERFEGRSSFGSWLTRIAINSALMIVRKKRSCEISIDRIDCDSGTSEEWGPPDFKEDPELSCLRTEREEMLQRAILRLRPSLRSVVELQQSQDYSTKELAQILGISVPAAKSRLLRAKLALRTSLQGNILTQSAERERNSYSHCVARSSNRSLSSL
jgi:RNA polymerase sigma-70 factor (ECF subfamily)